MAFSGVLVAWISALVPQSVSLILIIVILIKSIKQLKSAKTQTLIKRMYLITNVISIIGVTAFLSFMAISFLIYYTVLSSNKVISTIATSFSWIFIYSYWLMLLCILAMLLLRLWFTFKESVFEISKYQKWILIILYLTLIICSLGFTYRPQIIVQYMSAISVILYLTLTVYGMVLFANRMYALTKMRQSSLNQHNYDENEVYEPILNKNQMKILYTTTKYMTLLSIAIISTWVAAVLFIIMIVFMGSYGLNIYTMILIYYSMSVFCIDATINIICLYLQFPFNKVYYNKYCSWCGNCCTYLFTKMILRQMKQSAVELNGSGYIPPTSNQEQSQQKELDDEQQIY